MNKSVIVYGPQGCGKTTHAPALAKHFGVSKIVDEAETVRSLEPEDHLYLMIGRPAWATSLERRVLPFAEAMRQAGMRVPTKAVSA